MTSLVDTYLECDHATANSKNLLISIRPKYVDAILDGSKSVELRRTRPNVALGSVVLLYSSSPVKAIVGWACLADVFEGTPGEVWDAHQEATAVSGDAFDEYFDGSPIAFGLRLHRVVRASNPVLLKELRELGVEPPQSWRYLDGDLADLIRSK